VRARRGKKQKTQKGERGKTKGPRKYCANGPKRTKKELVKGATKQGSAAIDTTGLKGEFNTKTGGVLLETIGTGGWYESQVSTTRIAEGKEIVRNGSTHPTTAGGMLDGDWKLNNRQVFKKKRVSMRAWRSAPEGGG